MELSALHGSFPKLVIGFRDVLGSAPIDFTSAAVEQCDAREVKSPGDLMCDLLGDRLGGVGEQDGAAQGIESLHFSLPLDRLPGSPLGPRRKLAGSNRSRQEGKERHPVLRIGDRKGTNGRKEEIVKTQHCDDRRDCCLQEAAGCSDNEDCDQIREAYGRSIHMNQAGISEGDREDQDHSTREVKGRYTCFVRKASSNGASLGLDRRAHGRKL